MKTFKTAKLKLHHLRGHKRVKVDLALRLYTDAFRELLRAAEPRWMRLIAKSQRLVAKRQIDKKTNEETVWSEFKIDNRRLTEIVGELYRPDELSALAVDSLNANVAATLISLFELTLLHNSDPENNQQPSYPQGRETDLQPQKYNQALMDLAQRVLTVDEENKVVWELNRNREATSTPIFFSRERGHNLTEYEPGKWGVSLKLLAAKHPLGTTVRIPIEVTGWHRREYFRKGTPRTAFLVEDEGEYYLHVAFEFEVEPIETVNLIGVNRGMYKPGAWSLINTRGEVLKTGFGGRAVRFLQNVTGQKIRAKQKRGKAVSWRDWQQAQLDSFIHVLCNDIVAAAVEHKARVLYDEFYTPPKRNGKPKGGRILVNVGEYGVWKFTRSQYAKFQFILNYKCRMAGLPKPQPMFCHFITTTCCRCGARGKREKETFVGECGHKHDVDVNAATNVARRWFYRKADWEKNLNGWKSPLEAFHHSFEKIEVSPSLLVG